MNLNRPHPPAPAKILVLLLICLAFTGACATPASSTLPTVSSPPETLIASPTATRESPSPSPPVLLTPVSDTPAAGICGGPAEGKITGVVIYPDIPDPRCLKITGSQQLQVTNQTDSPLEIDLGPYHAVIQPGETYLFTEPMGNFLAPGVHPLLSSPYGGPELWLE